MGGVERLVILGGAGISAASNIPTFSSLKAAGILCHRFIIYSHIKGYMSDPQEADKTYDEFLKMVLAARPNPAHRALEKLQAKNQITFINQNVDGLGGGIPLHGKIKEIFCLYCGNISPFAKPFAKHHGHHDCDICQRVTPHRRNLVLSGEVSPDFELSLKAILQCNKVIAVGTEVKARTAQALLEAAVSMKKEVELWNPQPLQPDVMRYFGKFREGKAEVLLPRLVKEIS